MVLDHDGQMQPLSVQNTFQFCGVAHSTFHATYSLAEHIIHNRVMMLGIMAIIEGTSMHSFLRPCYGNVATKCERIAAKIRKSDIPIGRSPIVAPVTSLAQGIRLQSPSSGQVWHLPGNTAQPGS